MTKTIKIKSQREFLCDGSMTYKYVPASNAVKVITAAALEFNTEKSATIKVITKATEDEKAKVKLTGDIGSIDIFLNRLFAETELLNYFNIRI